MDFFLEIHNGECGLGKHFCDQVRFDTGRSQNPEPRIHDEEFNKGESTLLIKGMPIFISAVFSISAYQILANILVPIMPIFQYI